MIRRRWLLLLLLLVSTTVVVTECGPYYPLTPLGLRLSADDPLPPAPDRAIRLLFVGDTLLADHASNTLAWRGFDYPFAATRGLIQHADLAVVNLEGPISVAGAQRVKRWSYRMLPAVARALRRAGFDAATLANNHSLDTGPRGLMETRTWLQLAGVTPFGAGRNAAQAHQPARFRLSGLRVALLGYMAPSIRMRRGPVPMGHLFAGTDRPGTAGATPEQLRRDLQLARQRADLVLVSLHMGDRYQERPTAEERALAHRAIDAGADAVVGHGPHIQGPVELYRGRPIVYSLGNFAFGSLNVFARFSLVLVLEADPATRRLSRAQLLPLFTMNGNPWIWFQPKLLRGYQGRRALRRVLQLSGKQVAGLRLADHPPRLVLQLPAR